MHGTEETRHARYLAQKEEVARLRGELAAAQTMLVGAHKALVAARAHRDDLLSLARAARRPRWWPITGRRAQAAQLAEKAMAAVEEKVKDVGAGNERVEEAGDALALAEREAAALAAEWEAEKAARARYEAGGAPEGRTERDLFREFREQDRLGARGPEGRRTEEALRRYCVGKPARTDEERGWYEEFREAEAEEAEDIWEGVKARREAESRREFLAEWGEAPF